MKAIPLPKFRAFPEVNEEDKTAKVTYLIKPGMRAYVRRVEFRGNTKTADERSAP